MVSHAADGVRRPYKTVCDKVEHWAEVQPDHTAISFGDRKISYAELDNAASHIAWLLSRRNVGKGDKIPVLAQRSPEMVACFLGVLKSGALYVPIDTESWSQDRIQWVLNRVSARVILNTTTDQFPGYQEISHCAIEAAFSPAEDLVARGRADQQLDRPWHRIEPSNLAYIIFTSGTTSTPKGVMVQHSSVLNYVEQGGHETPFNLNATPSDRVMLIFSPGFDACTGVIVSTLCNGAQLQIATTSDFLHTVTLCTIMVCTPSVLNTIQDPTTCSRLHTVVLGGEAPPSSLVRRWAAALPTCAMYNFYGPTETTFASLVSRLFPEAPITLGRPMSNSRVLLLDGDEEAAYGEICITGPGLARGYFENEALTSEKFVDWRGERIYRTGDFARQTEHGLEFSGRKDSFVKNRGFLVNLESQVIPILHGCPDVMAATAFMHSGRLVAFVTPAEVDTLALRESLSSHHDAFVVPDLIRALDFLPLTPNGKADNRALQQLLDSEMSAKAGGAASSSDLISEDASVMDILKAALSTSLSLPVSDINERYSFRELGGNSLAGLKVLSFLRTRGLRLRLIHLFDLPNLSSICEVIEQEPASLGRDNTATLTTGPMTSVQAKMIQAGLRDAAVNYMLLRITFPHPGTTISPQRLQDSWHQVMQRHAIFRTTFVLKDGLQHVRPEMDAAWNCEEASQEQLEKLVKLRSQELRQRISLLPEQSEEFVPVQACNLVVVPGKASTLLVLAHHSQADGWSFSVILNELRSALDGRDLADPPQYMDVALAQKKLQDDAQGKVFWSELLENRLDQPPLALLPSSPDNEDTGWSTSQELGLGITPGYLESKARVLRRVTPATLFYCAWGLVLSNYTFTDNVSFGVVFSGRNIGTSGVDNVVGPLVNTCPFPLELGCYETINGLVSHAQTRLLHMMEHQWSADEAMAKIPAGRIANTFQSIVVMEYDLPTPDGPCEVLPEPWEVERKDRMEFGISLLLERGGDGALRARILFDGSRFAESSIRGLLSHFRSALHEFLQPQNTSIQTVRENMITGKERARLLNSANHPVEYAAHSATLKDAFESMATQYPDLRAVESVSGCMTYRELDVAANSLATHIRWSASPNDVVGVLTDGSLYWIVSILAVLKAGCVCCPIDINLPTTRIDTIRRQSGAVVFVAANRHCASVIDNSRARVIICDEFLNTSRESILPLSTVSEPRDVVYLVFTSGSTGTPKGVALHNQSILMAVDSEAVRLSTKPGRRNGQVYSLGFDVVTVEIFGTLCYGGTLVLKNPGDPLGHLRRVHAAYATPSLLAALSPDDFPRLDTVVLAGEPVPQSIADAWSHKQLFNGYGPCECGPISTVTRLLPGEKVTIGKAVPHLNVYLLDHHQCLVAPGVTGEIFISGPQVTDGYWNITEQTKKSFLPNPFSPGEVMYKTGDLGRWTGDMSLAYVGRMDNQVKVRGFRVELEEIERALVYADPTIQRAAAVVAGGIRIVAFVTPSSIDTSAVLSRLKHVLPAYTRPAQIIALDALPQSANLKINRDALRALASEYRDLGDLPSTRTERLVAGVWNSVLPAQKSRSIRRDDDFLGVGGNSLLAIQAARLISESVGHRVPVPLLIRETILSSLAEAIDKHALLEKSENRVETFSSYITNLTSQDDLAASHPLSELEEELYVWHTVSRTTSFLNTAFRFELGGDVNVELLRDSLVSVIRQEPILRARYDLQAGSVVRRIADNVSPPHTFTGDELNASRLQALVNKPFDLSKDQLIRAIIWERRPALATSLILVTHHIITDKASLATLLKSISGHYSTKLGSVNGNHKSAGVPEATYIQWARWLRQIRDSLPTPDDNVKQDFWKRKMDGITTIAPLRDNHAFGLELGSYESILIPYPAGAKVSQRMALAATALTLRAVYGSKDMVLGIPYANRDEPGVGSIMGVFLDRIPIRLLLNDTNTTSSDKLLHHVASEINLAVEKRLPYSQILAAAGTNRSVFDVMVIYHWRSDALENSLKLPGANVSITPIRARGAKFPLQLEFSEQEDGLHCGFEFDGRAISPSNIAAIMSFVPVAVDGLARQRSVEEILSGFPSLEQDAIVASPAYKTRVEKVIGAFSEALGLAAADIKPDTSFFSAGGTSTAALRLHYLLGQQGLQGDLCDIFRGPSLGEIAWTFYDGSASG